MNNVLLACTHVDRNDQIFVACIAIIKYFLHYIGNQGPGKGFNVAKVQDYLLGTHRPAVQSEHESGQSMSVGFLFRYIFHIRVQKQFIIRNRHSLWHLLRMKCSAFRGHDAFWGNIWDWFHVYISLLPGYLTKTIFIQERCLSYAICDIYRYI